MGSAVADFRTTRKSFTFKNTTTDGLTESFNSP